MRGIQGVALAVLLGFVGGSLAQQAQEPQRQGLVQEVRSIQDRIQSLNAALVELRQVYNQLGRQANQEQASQEDLQQVHAWLGGIIGELERDMLSISFERVFERMGVLQQQLQTTALTFARHRLEALRQAVEAGERAEETAQEISRIRADVERAFADAEPAAQASWLELEERLGRLEEQVRTGSAEASAIFEETLRRLDEELERSR